MPVTSKLATLMVVLIVLLPAAAFAALPGIAAAGENGSCGRRAADEIYPSVAADSSRGFDAASLSGKWCCMSSDNDAGRISGRCFTLYENGTYEYYAETSSTGYYGAVVSRQSDGGAWSATGNSITASSSRNGIRTYSLERKNHPQTGDLMLLIDGDAYVNYHRRRP